MTRLLITSVLLVSYSCFVVAQMECPTRNGVTENCEVIENCKIMMELLRNTTQRQYTWQLVRQALCGFLGSKPMVCCPTRNCIAPDGTQGTCGSVSSCAHVAKMLLSKPLTESTVKYVQSLRCDSPDEHSVCCGQPPPTTTQTAFLEHLTVTAPEIVSTTSKMKCVLTDLPPDPSTLCCGKGSGGGNRIYGGREAAIEEYPWLTIIEYQKDSEIKLLCDGVLISGRYVLTAGHCVKGSILNVGSPVNVRLGDYNISHSGPDCIEIPGGGIDCTDGELVVPIEMTIPHPGYDPSSELRRDDIALIRLRSIVQYTDFIRPICLPSTDLIEASPQLFDLIVTGWGVFNHSYIPSKVKLAVNLPYVSLQDCQPKFSRQLWEGQICAGGVEGKDSCTGDSGGPLMRGNGKIFELVGIVSFGQLPCGKADVPGVYTKVYKYLPWIRSQIGQ